MTSILHMLHSGIVGWVLRAEECFSIPLDSKSMLSCLTVVALISCGWVILLVKNRCKLADKLGFIRSVILCRDLRVTYVTVIYGMIVGI